MKHHMRNQELFDLMAHEHGLTLLESEMHEIEIVVARTLATDREHEAARQNGAALGAATSSATEAALVREDGRPGVSATIARMKRYVSQMAPHHKEREGGRLLVEAVELLESLERALDARLFGAESEPRHSPSVSDQATASK